MCACIKKKKTMPKIQPAIFKSCALQLFRSRLESTVASADCSPLRRLHDILEAQQGCVRRLRITWIHGAVEEVRDHRVHDLAKGIVDVHDLAVVSSSVGLMKLA